MELIAHRGASGYAPENTISAFKKAIDMGAKAFEFDVQMTKDEELVVIHDYALERTTTGKGFIKDVTLDYIKTVDAGVRFSKAFEGECVPTLSEVLEIMPKDVTINIEIKKLGIEQRNVAKKVLEVVKGHQCLNQVIFSSFDHYCLKRIKSYEDVPVGLLIESNMVNPDEYIKSIGLECYSINQSAAYISADFVSRMHKSGLKVYSYTVNEKSIAKVFESFGVDGIFTNYLDLLT